MSHLKYEIATTDAKNLNDSSKFNRNIKNTSDCVFNALQLLNIISKEQADILRIVVPDSGVTAEMIEKIFTSIPLSNNRYYMFKFLGNQSLADFKKAIMSIPPNKATFCGYKDINQIKHVFLIAKTLTGEYHMIDPNMLNLRPGFMCNLTTDSTCFSLLDNKLMYYLLHVSTQPLTTDQLNIMNIYIE